MSGSKSHRLKICALCTREPRKVTSSREIVIRVVRSGNLGFGGLMNETADSTDRETLMSSFLLLFLFNRMCLSPS